MVVVDTCEAPDSNGQIVALMCHNSELTPLQDLITVSA